MKMTKTQPADALLDTEFRKQMQGLKDMTAAINGTATSPVVFSTDAESVLNGLKVFEVIAAGFDGSTDASDDCVFWVASTSADAVKAAIQDTGAAFGGEVLGWSLADADFHLPGQSMQLSTALLEKASDFRNRNRAVA